MNKKIILLTNIPNPYRIPLFNVMNEKFSQNSFDLKIMFWARKYGRRKWRDSLQSGHFNYVILRSWQIRLAEEWYLFFPINLFTSLFKERPSTIITGGFSIASIIVFLFHLITKVPYIIWSGEINREGKTPSSLRTFLRKILAKKSSAFIAYGTKAGECLKNLDSIKSIF